MIQNTVPPTSAAPPVPTSAHPTVPRDGPALGGGCVGVGGSIAALCAAFLDLAPEKWQWRKTLDLGRHLESVTFYDVPFADSNVPVTVAFGILTVLLFVLSWRTARK